MSELNVYHHELRHNEYAEFYLKYEADKVISEKDKVITYARALVREDIKLILHQKYKRCLAMAGRCRLRGRLFGACGLYEKELWALKWHRRWLELAEKFKPNNSTAQ